MTAQQDCSGAYALISGIGVALTWAGAQPLPIGQLEHGALGFVAGAFLYLLIRISAS